MVVGGGPVGLASAITLSNAPHFYDVVVLEQSEKASGYDPTKAFLYLVNARGQEWTKRFPSVQEKLVERGSVSHGFGNWVTVPADPNEAVPPKFPRGNSSEPGYWVPRHAMVDLLEEVIEDQERSRQREGLKIGSIQVLPCQQCQSLKTLDDGQVEVTVLDTTDENARFEHSFVGNLVVGADGMNSAVRDCLADNTATKGSWLTLEHKRFKVKSWTSPATGLRMKVLQFPANFTIPNPDGDIVTESETIYAIRSINKRPLNYVSLGLLPVKDPNMARATNVITRPNHDIWKLKSAGEYKEWFIKAFPRLRLGEMISDSEWDRFYNARGTSFPKCQYCPGMQVSHPNGNSGVVLVGDAIHAFPPDIGQGINAGLGDVEALDRALKGNNLITNTPEGAPPAKLADALKEYEKVRGPEIRALIRLARFGSPYQYRQPLRKDRVGRFLWTLNVAMRTVMNKVSRGLVPPPAIIRAMDRRYTFRRLMRDADLTTVGFMTLPLLLIWKLFGAALLKGTLTR